MSYQHRALTWVCLHLHWMQKWHPQSDIKAKVTVNIFLKSPPHCSLTTTVGKHCSPMLWSVVIFHFEVKDTYRRLCMQACARCLSDCPAATRGCATWKRESSTSIRLSVPCCCHSCCCWLGVNICVWPHVCVRLHADLSHTKCQTKSKHQYTGNFAKSWTIPLFPSLSHTQTCVHMWSLALLFFFLSLPQLNQVGKVKTTTQLGSQS